MVVANYHPSLAHWWCCPGWYPLPFTARSCRPDCRRPDCCRPDCRRPDCRCPDCRRPGYCCPNCLQSPALHLCCLPSHWLTSPWLLSVPSSPSLLPLWLPSPWLLLPWPPSPRPFRPDYCLSQALHLTMPTLLSPRPFRPDYCLSPALHLTMPTLLSLWLPSPWLLSVSSSPSHHAHPVVALAAVALTTVCPQLSISPCPPYCRPSCRRPDYCLSPALYLTMPTLLSPWLPSPWLLSVPSSLSHHAHPVVALAAVASVPSSPSHHAHPVVALAAVALTTVCPQLSISPCPPCCRPDYCLSPALYLTMPTLLSPWLPSPWLLSVPSSPSHHAHPVVALAAVALTTVCPQLSISPCPPCCRPGCRRPDYCLSPALYLTVPTLLSPWLPSPWLLSVPSSLSHHAHPVVALAAVALTTVCPQLSISPCPPCCRSGCRRPDYRLSPALYLTVPTLLSPWLPSPWLLSVPSSLSHHAHPVVALAAVALTTVFPQLSISPCPPCCRPGCRRPDYCLSPALHLTVPTLLSPWLPSPWLLSVPSSPSHRAHPVVALAAVALTTVCPQLSISPCPPCCRPGCRRPDYCLSPALYLTMPTLLSPWLPSPWLLSVPSSPSHRAHPVVALAAVALTTVCPQLSISPCPPCCRPGCHRPDCCLSQALHLIMPALHRTLLAQGPCLFSSWITCLIVVNYSHSLFTKKHACAIQRQTRKGDVQIFCNVLVIATVVWTGNTTICLL